MMNKKHSITTITVLALVIGGLAIVPALDQQQAHASLFKDSSTKVKNLIKHIVKKIFNRGDGGPIGDGNG